MEGDEASYREACYDVELFKFFETRSPCQEVSEGEDLIDFHEAFMSCQEENEERDLIDFSEDATQGSLLSPLAEECRPTRQLESEETTTKGWSRPTSGDSCANWIICHLLVSGFNGQTDLITQIRCF